MTEDDKPATRADFNATRAEFKAELKATEERLSEQMRDIETALLRAFQNYAKGVAAQIQKLNGSEAATETRPGLQSPCQWQYVGRKGQSLSHGR